MGTPLVTFSHAVLPNLYICYRVPLALSAHPQTQLNPSFSSGRLCGRIVVLLLSTALVNEHTVLIFSTRLGKFEVFRTSV